MEGKNQKSEGSELAEALFVVFIFSLPILAAVYPFVASFTASTQESFVNIWQIEVRPIIMTLNAFLVAFIIFLILEIWPIQYNPSIFKTESTSDKEQLKQDPEILKRWEDIQKKASVPTSDNLRLSIIEADALVDTFLKKVGYGGDHMADRLSQISSQEIKSLDALWDAHRLRNILVHTHGTSITPKEGTETLRAYENFLKEVDAI